MNPHEADLINRDRQKQAEIMQEQLEKLGVMVRVAHFTGDSSYPTEYSFVYGNVRGSGPTFDMGLLDWIEHLLTFDKAVAYQSMETALQVLTGNILSLRTELLVIKAEVTKEE